MSAMALADSGRTSEIVRLSSIEPSYVPLDDLLDRLFDRGQIDEAEEVGRAHQGDEFHDKVYFRDAFFWRFAIRGKNIKDDALLPVVERIHDLPDRLKRSNASSTATWMRWIPICEKQSGPQLALPTSSSIPSSSAGSDWRMLDKRSSAS